MANVSIPDLPIAVSLDGSEQIEIVQPAGSDGTSKRTTIGAISTFPTTSVQFVLVDGAGDVLTDARDAAVEAGVLTLTDNGAGGTLVTSVATNGIGNTKLRQGAARSVIGNATNATANVADIAGTTDQVFRINGAGTVLAFGAIDLSKTAAVTGTLAATNGGTGLATYTLGDTLYSSATNTLSKLAGNTTSTRKFLRQTGTGVVSDAPVWDTILAPDVPGSALTAVSDTNVTLALGGTPATALLIAASVTAGWTGQLSLTRGGTNASLVASNGGLVYSTASALAILSGTATANQIPLSGTSAAPAWSTTTYPATSAAGTVLGSSSANVIAATATPILGIAGSVIGTLRLTGNTSGTVTITPQATAGSPTLTLPNATGTFAVSVSAPLALSATTGNLTVTGAAGMVLAGATPAFTATPTLGVAGATLGTLALAGNTSGTATITPQATAGSPTLTLPNASGTFAVSATAPLAVSATTGNLTITGVALTKGDDTNVTLTLAGAPTTALVTAASITAGWTGTLSVARGGTGLGSGTSGGIPYYSSTSTLASSALLTASAIVLGGGAGTTPVTMASLGTTTTVLHGNAAGAPTFGAVSLTADVSGTLPLLNAGTGRTSFTDGLLYYNGSSSSLQIQSAAPTGAGIAGIPCYLTGSSDVPTVTATPALGAASSTTGKILFANSGGTQIVTVMPASSSATAYNFVFPTTAGSSGQALLSGGGGTTAQSYGTLGVAAGGTGAASLTAYAVVCGGTTSTGALQSIASVGAAGNVLTSNGAAALPTFQAPAGGGNVTGPGSSTDNAVARFDGTGGTLIQNSALIVADTTASVSHGSGSGIPIQGTNTNDDAASTYKGEYMEQSRAEGAATGMTTGTSMNVTATPITLTAGDWEIRGVWTFVPAATTNMTRIIGSFSTTSATTNSAAGFYTSRLFSSSGIVTGNDYTTMDLPPQRVTVSAGAGTATYYMVANAAFSVSTMTIFGIYSARRIR